jgi:hypothetical protein
MNEKKIYITLDYELFFGRSSGSVDKSVLEPTKRLIEIARKHGVAFTFFVDAGMLHTMRKFVANAPELGHQYEKIAAQLRTLKENGHSIQLHVHPHWEDTVYRNGRWVVSVQRYRLHQFSDKQLTHIVTMYKEALENVVGSGVHAFRAGGWCIQPFSRIRSALHQNGIDLDSTLFRDGVMNTATHQFDFRGMPALTSWRFKDDPMQPDPAGDFSEIPISVTRYSRWFYLSMAFHRLIKTAKYRFVGDGASIGGGRLKTLKLILMGGSGVVSLDGFRVRRMRPSLKEFIPLFDTGSFVVIGHPKALCEHSFTCLDALARAYAVHFAVM